MSKKGIGIKKRYIILGIIGLVGIFLYFLPFFLFRDKNVVEQIRLIVQKNLEKSGLNVDIGNIHWNYWNQLTASGIRLTDLNNQSIPVATEKIIIKLNLFSLLNDRQSPEAILQEIELVNPRFEMERYQNGSWNFHKYLSKGERDLKLSTIIRIHNGIFEYKDEEYGKFYFKQISGSIDLSKYPFLQWDLKGVTQIENEVRWKATGKADLKKVVGLGKVSFNELPLTITSRFLLKPNVRFKSGVVDGLINFGWQKNEFWINDGQVKLTEAKVSLPDYHQDLIVKSLQAEFSPEKLVVKNGFLQYKGSDNSLSGELNLNNQAIRLDINSKNLKFQDLYSFFPSLTKGQISGVVDAKLKVEGTLKSPIVNGNVSISKVGLDFGNIYTFSDIHGRLAIVNNNVKIKRLSGYWDQTAFRIDGNIRNILAPNFDLNIFGFGIGVNQIYPGNLLRNDFKSASRVNFSGKLTGNLKRPVLTGMVEVEKLMYQEMLLSNLQIELGWDINHHLFKLTSLEGDFLDGKLSVRGIVNINYPDVTWNLTGKMRDINSAKIQLATEVGMSGNISADAIFKGKWKVGQPFDIGHIFGAFEGENIVVKDIHGNQIQGIFDWEEGKLAIETFRIKTGNGSIFGGLTWDSETLAATLSGEHLKVRDYLPNSTKYPLDGFFTGSMFLSGPLTDLNIDLKGQLTEVIWDSKPIGAINTSLNYKKGIVTVSETNLVSPIGIYQIDGQIKTDEEVQLNLDVIGQRIVLKEFTEYLDLDIKNEVSGFGALSINITGSLTNLNYSGLIELDKPGFGMLKMEQGLIEVDGDMNLCRIKNLHLVNSSSQIKLNGTVGKNDIKLIFNAKFDELEPLNLIYDGNILKGQLDLVGDITGSPASPKIKAGLQGSRLSFGTLNDQELNMEMSWIYPVIQIQQGKIKGPKGIIDFEGRLTQNEQLELDLTLTADNFQIKELTNTFNLNQIDVVGIMSGVAKINGTISNPQIKLSGVINEGILNRIPLTCEFDLNYFEDKLDIQRIELRNQDGYLYLQGRWENSNYLKVYGSLNHFPVEILNPYLSSSKINVNGKADATINLEWSGKRRGEPVIRGNYRVNTGKLQINEKSLDNISLRGEFTEKGIIVDEGLITILPGNIRLNGFLPWSEAVWKRVNSPIREVVESRALNLNVSIKNIPAETFNLNPENYLITEGTINGNLKLSGDLSNPWVSGAIDCSIGELIISGMPTINTAQISLNISNNLVKITKAQGAVDNGLFNIEGELELKQFKPNNVNLNSIGKGIYYKNSFFEGYGDFKINLHGELNQPTVSGSVTVYDSKFGFGLNRGKGKKNNWKPKFDLTVKTGKNVRYRQIGIADVTIGGSVHLTGDLNNPKLEGEIKSTRGVITLYGQNFKVNRGLALFKPAQGIFPYLDVESSVKAADVEILLLVKGQYGTDLAVNLRSQPYLPQNEIYALLNWSEFNGDKPLSVDGVVTNNLSFVTDTLLGDVFYQVRNKLHLDYLYLDSNYALNDFRLNIGDFITDQLYVSYSRSLMTTQSNEYWGFDYYLTPNFTAGGTYSTEEGTLWRLTYRVNF